MIRRPENLVEVSIDLVFNLVEFEEMEIDMAHINRDYRSSLNVEEVTQLVYSKLNGLALAPSSSKIYDDGVCDYFATYVTLDSKKLKLVFCICSDRPKIIGVITMFRFKGTYESL